MTSKEILIRLYKNYTSKYLNKILLAGFFSILVAGSTSAVAYLLDPAIKRIFVDKDQTLIYLIPIAIILAFSTKGFSLYLAKVTMINVAENVKKNIDKDKTILVMCAAGGRSMIAANLLKAEGYTALNISDGYSGNGQDPGWKNLGLPSVINN